MFQFLYGRQSAFEFTLNEICYSIFGDSNGHLYCIDGILGKNIVFGFAYEKSYCWKISFSFHYSIDSRDVCKKLAHVLWVEIGHFYLYDYETMDLEIIKQQIYELLSFANNKSELSTDKRKPCSKFQ